MSNFFSSILKSPPSFGGWGECFVKSKGLGIVVVGTQSLPLMTVSWSHWLQPAWPPLCFILTHFSLKGRGAFTG